jgi:hypothetical protein
MMIVIQEFMRQLLAGLVLMATTLRVFAGLPPEEVRKKADATLAIISEAYNSTHRLSYSDAKILLQLPEIQGEFNRAASPMLRDATDSSMDGGTWLVRNREGVVQCTNLVMRMDMQVKLLEDTGAQSTVRPILDANVRIAAGLRQIETLCLNGQGDVHEPLVMIKNALKARSDAGMPIIRKLRKLSGAEDFDKDAAKILEENARSISR